MKCPHCGKEFPDDLRSDFCPSCGGRFDEESFLPSADSEGESLFPEETTSPGESLFPEDEEAPFFTAEPSEPEGEEEYYCPWEDRERLGFFQAWWETNKAIVIRPSEFFKKMPPTGSMGDAVLYAIIWLLIWGLVSGVYGMINQALLQVIPGLADAGPFTPGGAPDMWRPFGTGTLGMAMPLVQGLVCLPVGGLIGLIIVAGIIHLFLRLFQGSSHPYEGTLRTLCYVATTLVLVLFPCCGTYIAGIYGIVLSIIGLNEVHQCGGGRAAAAVLIPIVVLCALCCVGLVLLGAGMASFMGSMEGGI